MRGDKSFAYDLIVPLGRVSSRVALLLRSTERKPTRTRFVDYIITHCFSDLIHHQSEGFLGPTGPVLRLAFMPV
jgi:hypothetical protein